VIVAEFSDILLPMCDQGMLWPQIGAGETLVNRSIETARHQHLDTLKQHSGIVVAVFRRYSARRCPGTMSLTEGRGGSGRCQCDSEQSRQGGCEILASLCAFIKGVRSVSLFEDVVLVELTLI
jgi:hypothetical protein